MKNVLLALLLGALFAAGIAGWAGLIYVVQHFVVKYW